MRHRAYLVEIDALVKDIDLKITDDSGSDQEFEGARNDTDAIDLRTSWRKVIEQVKAEVARRSCPICGKFHGAATAIASANVSDPIAPTGGRPIEQDQNAADSMSVAT